MTQDRASSHQMVQRAMAAVRVLDPAGAAARLGAAHTVFVDVRDAADWTSAHIPGAVSAPRGMLEFYIDPDSAFHLPLFDPLAGNEYVFYCGSGARAALSAKLAQDMGLQAACIAQGMRGWREAALPTESAPGTIPTTLERPR